MSLCNFHAVMEEEVGQQDNLDGICVAIREGVLYHGMDTPFIYWSWSALSTLPMAGSFAYHEEINNNQSLRSCLELLRRRLDLVLDCS